MLILIIYSILILITELTLWKIFRKKLAGLSFPSEIDESFHGYFSINKIRIFAIIHTIILLATTYLFYFLLWI